MVSRIDLGPDGGPYVELDEDAGEFIIRVPQDNVSFDGADLNSVGTASVTALEARSATGRDVTLTHIGRETVDADSLSVSVSEKYMLLFADYRMSSDGGGSIDLRFNGDGTGTGDYAYFDESGTPITGADGIELISATGSGGEALGTLEIHQREGKSGRASVHHNFAGGRFDRFDGFATAGSRQVQEDITSIDISGDLNSGDGTSYIDVWGWLRDD